MLTLSGTGKELMDNPEIKALTSGSEKEISQRGRRVFDPNHQWMKMNQTADYNIYAAFEATAQRRGDHTAVIYLEPATPTLKSRIWPNDLLQRCWVLG